MMMVGIPGSGKSFFATKFSEAFNTPYIDSLAIERRSKDAQAAGELLSLVMSEIAKTGQSFIYEGNSDARVRRTEFAQWARKHGYKPLFIWVQLDQAAALKRTLKAKTLDTSQFNMTIGGFTAPNEHEKPVVISGKHTFASQARVVLANIGQANRPAATEYSRESLNATQRPTISRTNGARNIQIQ